LKSCLADEILAFQEGFYSLELVENGPRAVPQGYTIAFQLPFR